MNNEWKYGKKSKNNFFQDCFIKTEFKLLYIISRSFFSKKICRTFKDIEL